MPLRKLLGRARGVAPAVNVVKQVAGQAQQISKTATSIQSALASNPFATPAVMQQFKQAQAQLQQKVAEARQIQSTVQNVVNTAQGIMANPTGALLSAVGRGAANLPQDVATIQDLLNKRLGLKLPVDGIMNPKTLEAIQDVSRRVTQVWNATQNLDPKGAVMNWLKSSQGLPPLPTGPQIDAIRDKVNAIVPIPPKVDEMINKGKQFLDKAAPYYEKASEMVKDAKEHGIVGAVGIQANQVAINKLDEFMQKHLPYDKTFVDFKKEISASWAIFQLKAGASANINAKITGSRSGNKVTCQARLNAKVAIHFSVGFGFSLNALIGSIDIGASLGLSAEAELNASASASLEANGPTIAGTLNPFTADLTVHLKGFIELRAKGKLLFWEKDFGPKLASTLAEKIKGKAEGNRVVYDLGRVELLRVTAPSFALSFDWASKRFSARGSKGWVVERHPALANRFKIFPSKIGVNVGQAVANAAKAVGSAVRNGAKAVGKALRRL